MLLSPLLEMTCIRPDFDVAKPSELGFDALEAALAQGKVTTAWLSPASARTILSTAAGRTAPIALTMLAGAPISDSLLRGMRELTGGEVRTPYGMTECLPVTDGIRTDRRGVHGGGGVGRPLPGCRVEIDQLPGVEWGEILIAAPWLFDGYDGALAADLSTMVSLDGVRFHRSGDVGYLEDGELFSLGRRIHVIETCSGLVASVSVEENITTELDRDVAAVGVGPAGAQVVAVVVASTGKLRLADVATAELVRSASTTPLAAVLEGELPTDVRHQSKVDRVALGLSVATLLAGR